MKVYTDVILIIKETNTLSSTIKKLGKIKATTEDDKLISLLTTVILDLQVIHAKTKNKSTPVCLNQNNNDAVRLLANYSQQTIGNKKPEWQILAERNGWAPKI